MDPSFDLMDLTDIDFSAAGAARDPASVEAAVSAAAAMADQSADDAAVDRLIMDTMGFGTGGLGTPSAGVVSSMGLSGTVVPAVASSGAGAGAGAGIVLPAPAPVNAWPEPLPSAGRRKRKRARSSFYDPTLATLPGDPRLQPAPGIRGADLITYPAAKNVYAAFAPPDSSPMPKPTIPATAPGVVTAELLADMQRAVQLSAMLGAQQAAEAATTGDIGRVTPSADVVAAAAAAAASAMAPYMMQMVQAQRNAAAAGQTSHDLSAAELAKVAGVGASFVQQLREGASAAAASLRQPPAPGPGLTGAASAGFPTPGPGALPPAGAAAAPGAAGVVKVDPAAVPSITEAQRAALVAEERRKKRLERNRRAARESRKRHKHRVAEMEKELARLHDRMRALGIHQWGMNSVNKTRDLSSNMPMVETDSAEALRKGLDCSDPVPYNAEEDNYAELITHSTAEKRQRALSPTERLRRSNASLLALRRSTGALQDVAMANLHLIWAVENCCPKAMASTASRRCSSHTCTEEQFAAFKARKLDTMNKIKEVLGTKCNHRLGDVIAGRPAVMETMRWLRRLAPCLGKFESNLGTMVQTGTRLAQTLTSVLTPQQVDKLGTWFAENEYLLDEQLAAEWATQEASCDGTGLPCPVVHTSVPSKAEAAVCVDGAAGTGKRCDGDCATGITAGGRGAGVGAGAGHSAAGSAVVRIPMHDVDTAMDRA